MTFGLEADQSDLFCKVLEDNLRSRPGNQDLDVMNFGVPAYGTGQELLLLQKDYDRFLPDVVILMLFEQNDFDDNTLIFGAGRYVPHFKLDEGHLVLRNTPTFLQKTMTILRDKSVLFYTLTSRLGAGMRFFTKYEPSSEEEKIELIQRLIEKMDAFCRPKHARFMIYDIVEPHLSRLRFEAVQRTCAAQNIPLFEIPLLAEERIGGTGHWNEKGHRRAADVMLHTLRETGYVK